MRISIQSTDIYVQKSKSYTIKTLRNAAQLVHVRW